MLYIFHANVRKTSVLPSFISLMENLPSISVVTPTWGAPYSGRIRLLMVPHFRQLQYLSLLPVHLQIKVKLERKVMLMKNGNFIHNCIILV